MITTGALSCRILLGTCALALLLAGVASVHAQEIPATGRVGASPTGPILRHLPPPGAEWSMPWDIESSVLWPGLQAFAEWPDTLPPGTPASLDPVLAAQIRSAVLVQPQWTRQQERQQEAEAFLQETRAARRPQVRFGLELREDLRTSDPGDAGASARTDAVLSATQWLWDFGAVTARIEEARLQAQLEDGPAAQETLESLTMQALRVHYEVLRYTAQVALTEHFLAQTRELTAQVRARVEAGAGSLADALRSESRSADAEARLMLLRGQRARAQAAYREVFGVFPDEFPLPELRFPFPDVALEPFTGAGGANGAIANHAVMTDAGLPVTSGWEVTPGEQAILQRHPALLQQRLVQESAAAEARAAQAALWPSLSLRLEGRRQDIFDTQSGSDPLDKDSLSLFLRSDYTVYSGGASRAREQQAQARARQAQEQWLETRRALTREIRFADADLLARRAELPAQRLAVLADALTVQAYREQFTIGRRSLTDLLDSERDLFNNAQILIDRRIDHDLAGWQRQRMYGELLSLFALDAALTTD